MAVRAGGNTENDGNQTSRVEYAGGSRKKCSKLWQAESLLKGLILLQLWAGSTVVGSAQLQSRNQNYSNAKRMQSFQSCKGDKVQCKDKYKADAIGDVIIWPTAWGATVHTSTTDKCNVCRHIPA